MKKIFFKMNLMFTFLLFSVAMFAQKQVTGKVTSADNQPLPGVSILVKGTTNGVSTDFDGNYTITKITDNAVLVFSYLGSKTKEVTVGDKTIINVVLQDDVSALSEIVVVGYGTKKKSEIISSVSTVSSAELAKASVPNLQSALSGRLSGVFSRQTSGEPGRDGANIQIRGFGNALIIVDGVQGRDYSDLDPNEIESISVLKDAASAAVYGNQGANGVVLVTTKRGKIGKPKFSLSTRYGLQEPHRMPQVLSTNQWQTLVTEYRANEALIRGNEVTAADLERRVYDYDTNWYDELLRAAPISQHNVNISGGTEKIKYFMSGGFLHQEGIWKTNSVSKDRFNVRSNIDVDLNDNLKVSLGFGGIINQVEYPGASSELIAARLRSAPFIPVKYPGFKEYASPTTTGGGNPVALADPNASGYSRRNERTYNINFITEYKVPFLDGLSLKGVVGYDTYDRNQKTWNTDIVYRSFAQDSGEFLLSNNASNADKATLSRGDGFNSTLTLQGFINYKQSFEGHNFDTSLIYERNQSEINSFNSTVGDFPSTVLDQFAGGLNTLNKFNTDYERKLVSEAIIGRLSYDYESKYLLNFNFRYDGAQHFAPGKKWGFFPSAAVGWVVSKEDFMESISNTLTQFKLKASWGKLGDLSSARNYYLNTGFNYYQSGFLYPGNALAFGDRVLFNPTETNEANPDFTWATSTTLNLGFEATLWENLFTVSAEYFVRNREGLPAQRNNDNAGALATVYNLNSDRTVGFDLSIGHDYKIGEFKYGITGNLSWARTKNIYNEDNGQYTNGRTRWRFDADGNWNNVRWGHEVIGRYQNQEEIDNAPIHRGVSSNAVILPGDLKYEDYNGDGFIDEQDQKPIGRGAYPELIFGANFNAEWRGFDFSMFWQGAARSEFNLGIFDYTAFSEGNLDVNTWEYFSDRWRKADYTDPNSAWIPGEQPAIRDFQTESINNLPSTFRNQDGKYIRLKNIELGYSIPKYVAKNLNITSLRLYVNATNALTFSENKFIDPEQREGGFNLGGYPQIRSFNLGLNLKF
ncbi:TonB-dependent receptor [Polaribacter batillariae]|uniref:TonB-dependent receptor n=1 Tax=Polaribacter batillariae TaxID=2808900 RepID=A0ABX7SXD0_9FLAO|nr:TonB-dependent receptor [Polaribacter batillariae]QTD37636.1 TonB-dependent receptor [Polaribacter batillariae]